MKAYNEMSDIDLLIEQLTLESYLMDISEEEGQDIRLDLMEINKQLDSRLILDAERELALGLCPWTVQYFHSDEDNLPF